MCHCLRLSELRVRPVRLRRQDMRLLRKELQKDRPSRRLRQKSLLRGISRHRLTDSNVPRRPDQPGRLFLRVYVYWRTGAQRVWGCILHRRCVK